MLLKCLESSQPCIYHKFRKTFGNFLRWYPEFFSKFGEKPFQEYDSLKNLSPDFYGDLVYELRRVKGTANFVLSD